MSLVQAALAVADSQPTTGWPAIALDEMRQLRGLLAGELVDVRHVLAHVATAAVVRWNTHSADGVSAVLATRNATAWSALDKRMEQTEAVSALWIYRFAALVQIVLLDDQALPQEEAYRDQLRWLAG